MKLFLNFLLASTLLLTSCDSDDDTTNTDSLSTLTDLNGETGLSYDESLSKWTGLKTDNGRSYIYQTDIISFTGDGSTTEIKVINNSVVSRVYQSFTINGETGERTITDTYSENEAALGTNQEGAAPLTIDELYNSCASEYLVVDQENNTIYLQTEVNGLLTLCGFTPNNCADDCFTGVSIKAFDWIN